MGATFARSRTFVAGETLTATNLNGVETNILNNFTPAGMDDYSANAAEMRVVTDPYPAGAESLATSAQGELERLRYIIAQITGKTYWYQDPAGSVAAASETVIGSVELLTNAEAETGTDTTRALTAANLAYVIQRGQMITGTAAGTDTYTATLAPVIASYTTRAYYLIKFTNANTGAATLNLNALGAKNIKKEGTTALVSGDIPAGHVGILYYDGTNMVLCNPKSAGAVAATQAEQEAGSSTTVFTAPGRQQYHPSAAKAWVRIMADGTISDYYGVTSVSRTSIGEFVANLTTAFNGTGYVVFVMTQGAIGAPSGFMTSVKTLSTTSITVQVVNQAGNLVDPTSTYIVCFGDQ